MTQPIMRFIPASSIKPQKQKWFMQIDGEPALPLKTCSVFAGIGGEGKSSFATYAASLLSRGQLEGDLHGQAHATIVFGPEDDWSSVHLPRFTAAGADLNKIYRVFAEVWTDYGVQEQELVFPLNTQMLEDAVIQTGAKLIIVDPISVSMQGDMNKVQDVRHAVGALDALAKKHDLAVILINHFKKGGTSVSEKMSGSHGLRDVVRAYLAFGTDEETGERIITQDKNNYGTGRGSWKFALVNTVVETADGPTEAPRVQLLGASDITVKDLIDRETNDGEGDDRNAAQAFVLDYLKDQEDGEAKAGDVIKAGRAAGFSENEIKHARRRCKDPKIVSAKSAFGAGWVWRVEESTEPQGATENPQGAEGAKNPRTAPSLAPSQGKPQDATKEPLPHALAPSAPSAPSTNGLAPSTRPSCHKHGTNYRLPNCSTCLQLAKEMTHRQRQEPEAPTATQDELDNQDSLFGFDKETA